MRLRKLSILLGAAAISVGVLGAVPALTGLRPERLLQSEVVDRLSVVLCNWHCLPHKPNAEFMHTQDVCQCL